MAGKTQQEEEQQQQQSHLQTPRHYVARGKQTKNP